LLPGFSSLLFDQHLLNLFQVAILFQEAEIKVNRLPLWKIKGQHPPLATGYHQVKNRF
jgi:hypothetical protein